MNKSFHFAVKGGVVLLALIGLLNAASVFAITFPQRLGYVNDYATLLSQEDKGNLEKTLSEFEQKTSNELNVVIVNDFQGMDSFTYSQELFNTWKIGKAGKNNGILFVIGPKEGFPFPERGDVFINIGAGLEGALPDSLTGTILKAEVFPQFKSGKFALGVSGGVAAIIKATQGEYIPTPTPADPSSPSNALFAIGFFVVFIIVAIILNKFFPKKGKGGKGSGPTSFFGGGAGSGSSSSSSGGGGMSRGGGAGGSW